MSYLIVYCVTMWIASTYSMYEALRDDPTLAGPREIEPWIVVGLTLVVLMAPIWLPVAFFNEWRRG